MNTQNDLKPDQIICVACPKGCRLNIQQDGDQVLVTNEGCKRGVEYARREILDPRRMVATTVRISGGIHPLLPVYTAEPFPKARIMDLLALLRKTQVQSPIQEGQSILQDALGTGIAVLASRDM
ncbi:MAG TPA: molybdopterin oxidoreductase [Anaerolineaceae bacterium]|nr:molybdopterin oxidoreductase [Anaerolineaceae bacterium]